MITYSAFTKRFASRTAVDNLTLSIHRGEAVALLGPNGSGKTTTLKAAAGLIRATHGDVRVGDPGRAAADPDARTVLSFLPQRVTFPDALTGREVVEFYRRLRQVDQAHADSALKIAALNGSSVRPVGTYSGGMVQRLGLAVALMPASPILLLDEPTAALDPEGLAAFYGVVERRRADGQTIFFTSHQLGDAERIADRFAILVDGRLVAVLTRRELADRLAARGVMRLRVATPSSQILDRVRTVVPGAHWSGDELVISGPAADRPRAIDCARDAGALIVGLTSEEGRLDVLYRELTGAAA